MTAENELITVPDTMKKPDGVAVESNAPAGEMISEVPESIRARLGEGALDNTSGGYPFSHDMVRDVTLSPDQVARLQVNTKQVLGHPDNLTDEMTAAYRTELQDK